MTKLLPLAIFIALAILSQVVSFLGAASLDRLGLHWWSIIAFGVLSAALIIVAWRLTVFIVDHFLVPRGIVEGTPAKGAKA